MNKLILSIGLAVFVGLIVFSLYRELDRNEQEIQNGITGVIHLAHGVGAELVRTDNAYIFLFPSDASDPVAMHVINPFLPPVTFYIGQQHALKNYQLHGSYRLLVIVDKDGNPERPAPGEVIGALTEPIPLGTERFDYVLDSPFLNMPSELKGGMVADTSQQSIEGIIAIAPELQKNVSSTDRVVIMLFDPRMGRPAAIKIIPHFIIPQRFSIGPSDTMGNLKLEGEYSLRILTDKNNQPFQSTPGEIVGRSKTLIPLGTKNIEFILDEPYVRE